MKSIPYSSRKDIKITAFEDVLGMGSGNGNNEQMKVKEGLRCVTHSIKSSSFNVSTIRSSKLALSAFDNKRYLLNCGIHSLPYGHWKINKFADYCLRCEIDCYNECNCKLDCKTMGLHKNFHLNYRLNRVPSP